MSLHDGGAVRYDGVCPLCGSRDGTEIKGKDGKFRNLCRVMGCPAMYKPLPLAGYSSAEDAANPFESDIIKAGMTVSQYLGGE